MAASELTFLTIAPMTFGKPVNYLFEHFGNDDSGNFELLRFFVAAPLFGNRAVASLSDSSRVLMIRLLGILLFVESWLKKGLPVEDLWCTPMIEELVLPLVGSETISEKMEAKAKGIARLIKDPDYVRRSGSSIDADVAANQDFLGPASANLKTVLRYEANSQNGLKG